MSDVERTYHEDEATGNDYYLYTQTELVGEEEPAITEWCRLASTAAQRELLARVYRLLLEYSVPTSPDQEPPPVIPE